MVAFRARWNKQKRSISFEATVLYNTPPFQPSKVKQVPPRSIHACSLFVEFYQENMLRLQTIKAEGQLNLKRIIAIAIYAGYNKSNKQICTSLLFSIAFIGVIPT